MLFKCLKQSLELSQDVRAQLQARLAAPSATQIAPVAVEEEAPIPVRQPVQQVVSETPNSNQAILEAIQSLSIHLSKVVHPVQLIYIAEMMRVPRPKPQKNCLSVFLGILETLFGMILGMMGTVRMEEMVKRN